MPYEELPGLELVPVKPGEQWGPLYAQRWFKLELRRAEESGPLYLRWKDQSPATVWWDGEPRCGLDAAHQECALPDRVTELWLEAFCVNPFLNVKGAAMDPGGSRCEAPELLHRDDEAWHAWHDLTVLFDLAAEERNLRWPELGREPRGFGHQPSADRATPLLRRLLRALGEACDAHERGGGAAAVRAALAPHYAALHGSRALMRATLTGHAHIDLVWLWPERVGEHKAAHAFATADALMTAYPEFRFTYSQTASYRAVARRSPGLMRRVEARIAERRWDATGAAEVEGDTLLPTGEAIVRNLLHGQRRFKALTGEPSRVMWLPDVFGYSGCLPGLLAECGAEFFFTTKLSWNAISPFPHTSFWWEGQDGRRVLAHLSGETGYSGSVDLGELRKAELSHRQADVHAEFLAPTGHGDGGGGPTASMCERARRLGDLAGAPATGWDTPTRFFERLSAVADALPSYRGELYLEYHRGVYTTHAALKLAYRRVEKALRAWEAAASARGVKADTEAIWDRAIFAQFHDYLPGSSVPAVYAEALPELAALAERAEREAARLLGAEKSGGAAAWFNPLGTPLRHALPDGRVLELPPLSALAETEARAEVSPLAEPGRLANGEIEARFDSEGRLTALCCGGREIALAGPTGDLWLYPDHPANFDAWDIDRHSLELGARVGGPAEIRVENSAGEAAVTVRRTLGRSSVAELRYALRPGDAVLRVSISLDWREPRAMLKYGVATRHAGQDARFGAPFGSVKRGQWPGEPRDEARWEAPGSRWAAVIDDSGMAGLVLLAEAKYGFRARAGTLDISLVRSPLSAGAPGEGHGWMYPESLLGELPAAGVLDLGRHEIALALAAYAPDAPREKQAAALAESVFEAPQRAFEVFDGPWRGLEGVPSLAPVWVKPADDGAGVIVRLHETLGAAGEARARVAEGWTVERTDLPERKASPCPEGRFEVGAYEVVSLRLRRSS